MSMCSWHRSVSLEALQVATSLMRCRCARTCGSGRLCFPASEGSSIGQSAVSPVTPRRDREERRGEERGREGVYREERGGEERGVDDRTIIQ